MHRKIWGKYQNHYQLTEYKINNMYCMMNKTMEKINKLLYKHNIYKLIVFFCIQFVIQIALLIYCFRNGALRWAVTKCRQKTAYKKIVFMQSQIQNYRVVVSF